MSFSLNEEQRAALQPEVQMELEKREWAEPGDNVMAEYVTVLLANGNTREKVHVEMDDLVGSDFHPSFLDWLFDAAQHLVSGPVRSSGREYDRDRESSPPRERERDIRERSPIPAPARSRRLLDSALGGLGQESSKRKHNESHSGNGTGNGFEQNKRRISDGPISAPGAPRAMLGMEGKGLADRMGPRQGGGRGGMAVRGMGRQGGMGMGMGGGGGFGGGFRGNGMNGNNNNMSQGFGSFFNPGQQEMMAQMMMMQANMAQMGEMMQHMVEEKEMGAPPPPAPKRTAPVKVPHGTKLGGHSVSAITPKPSSVPGPIPEKPSSKALCRYSVGCSNARCPYSHPSPVADEQSGMVLSEEPCEEGKKCKDAECTKSHVSPAAVLGETAGPSRLLCKYQNCSNPACAFRHEDANGNPIPPPALTAAKTAKDAATARSAAVASAAASGHAGSDNEDGDFEVVMSSRGLMDGALEEKGADKSCRYGERCTRADCKFTHPASRPTPKAKFGKGPLGAGSGNGFGTGGPGMNKSKKFGSAATPSAGAGAGKGLDPSAGSFVPKPVDNEVTMS